MEHQTCTYEQPQMDPIVTDGGGTTDDFGINIAASVIEGNPEGGIYRPGVYLEALPAVCADRAALPHDAANRGKSRVGDTAKKPRPKKTTLGRR